MKKVIFLSGVPGSGKSTLANKLAKKAQDDGLIVTILSTDNFFIVNNNYNWLGEFISEGHKWCQGLFYRELYLGTNVIIVDNTNLEEWQFYPYVDSLIKHGYEFEIQTPKTAWRNDPEKLAEKNTHGVPISTIKSMLDKQQDIKEMTKNLNKKFKKLI